MAIRGLGLGLNIRQQNQQQQPKQGKKAADRHGRQPRILIRVVTHRRVQGPRR